MAAEGTPSAPSSLLPRLREQGLAPRKGLGQHYLSDPNLLASIVAAAELPPGAVVIEVGPGPGTLTAALLPHVGRLIAIELDDALAPLLAEHFRPWPQFHLIHGDALRITPQEALAATGGPAPYYLVANLPYYLAAALLRHYLEADPPPVRAVVTVQLEVAQRIVARPPQMSLLSVAVQALARPSIVRRLPPGAFYPPPKVHSAVLRLDPYRPPRLPPEERERFFAVVRAGFGQRRKTLRNSLAAGLGLRPDDVAAHLEAVGLSPACRAQELDVEDWLALARRMSG
ncbi:MAG: 16S rRNA (adenine(1518)-N(6)/adenine(1519)-N(6))-dimethyltransferase RsmA [Caldilineales bacterium]|nr:16S rRNA (adenine(1518)-N(6)/adenine(1519)-N(6))-dimethyltransferase RsmA [Caldilineales bacterium]